MPGAPARSPSTERGSVLAVLSPEARLVLLSAGEGTDDEMRALLSRPLEWGKVLWLAEQERATARFGERLQRIGASPPAEVAAALQAMAMVSDFRMLHLRQRLQDTVRVLSAAGIEVVLLKGAALAEVAYASFADRPMHDVDVLVAPGRAEEARRLLLDAGWTGDVDARTALMYEHHHHLPPLTDGSGTGTKLELHTSLFLAGHPFALTAERVWGARRPIDLGGVTTSVPDTGHLLLHVCLHFAWSNMLRSGSWRTFRDIERLVQAGGVEWRSFVELASESNASSLCYWTFRLASRSVGVGIPGWVQDALDPGLPEGVLRRLERHYLLHLLQTEWICPSVRVGYRMWELGMRPGRSGLGRARPWAHEDRIRADFLEEVRGGGALRLTNQLRRLGQWGHYLRLLWQPARSG